MGRVTRFSSDRRRPDHLLASIVALSERTSQLALEAAIDAAQAGAVGDATLAVERVCRLAVAAGVALGEVAWLVTELESSNAGPDQLHAAGDAVAYLQRSVLTVAHAIQGVADSGGSIEIHSSADALRRAGLALEDLLPALQH